MRSVVPSTRHELVVAAGDAGRRLDLYLAQILPGMSRSQAQRLIREGAVTIGERAARPSVMVTAGTTIVVHVPPPLPDVPQPEDLPLSILYDDDDIVVIEKPAGTRALRPGLRPPAG